MASSSDIREEIFKDDDAKRIIIKVNTECLDPRDYRASASRVVNEFFPNWELDDRILFLAIEVWSDRTYMAIDINHHDYNFDTAHKSKTVLPVYVLRQRRGRMSWALVRWPQEDKPLAAKLAYLHNAHGFDTATPFLEDHNSRIVHANPREFIVHANPREFPV